MVTTDWAIRVKSRILVFLMVLVMFVSYKTNHSSKQFDVCSFTDTLYSLEATEAIASMPYVHCLGALKMLQ